MSIGVQTDPRKRLTKVILETVLGLILRICQNREIREINRTRNLADLQ